MRAAADLNACTRASFLRAFQSSIRHCQRRWLSSSCCSLASIRLTNSWARALRLPSRAWFMICGHRWAGSRWSGGSPRSEQGSVGQGWWAAGEGPGELWAECRAGWWQHLRSTGEGRSLGIKGAARDSAATDSDKGLSWRLHSESWPGEFQPSSKAISGCLKRGF